MLKILLFEDDLYLRGMYVAKFQIDGFDVAAYEHPTKDPVNIVLKEKPDIISMDVIMPVSNGFVAAEKIKADHRTKNVPLFFLTNLGQQSDIDHGMAAGAFTYIIKANHMPSEIVDVICKKLGVRPKPASDVPRSLLEQYLANPSHDPIHAKPVAASKVIRTIATPRPKRQHTVTLPYIAFVWLVGLAGLSIVLLVLVIFGL